MILQLDENYKVESDSTAFVLYKKMIPKDKAKEPYYTALSYNNDLRLALNSYARYTSKEIIKESKDIETIVNKLDEIKRTIEKVGERYV